MLGVQLPGSVDALIASESSFIIYFKYIVLRLLLLFLASLKTKLAYYCSLIYYFNNFEFASKKILIMHSF